MKLRASTAVALSLGTMTVTGALAGCAPASVVEGKASRSSNYTVDGGAKFVVSATPERVVLRKQVDGEDFPFDKSSLTGKGILIHPVSEKAPTGVYTRAVSVSSEGDTYVIKGKPLTLEEMAEMTEDDIVRIYVDSQLGKGEGTSPRSVDLGALLQPANAQPLGLGLLSTDPDSRGEEGPTLDLSLLSIFSKNVSPIAGVSVSHTVSKADLKPLPLARWSREEGVELGFRGELTWRSKLSVEGSKGGEIFRSPEVSTPPFVVVVPIGAAPVPISFTLTVFARCDAAVTGAFEATVSLEADASAQASVKISTSGIEQGQWAPKLDGKISLVPKFSVGPAPTISCTTPSVKLSATIGGVLGGYVGINGSAGVTADSASFEGALVAGAEAKFFGFSYRKSVTLTTVKLL